MFLTESLINKFIDSISELDLKRIEAMDDEMAMGYISFIYEDHYGAPPTGMALHLIRHKFKLYGIISKAA